MTEMLLKIVEKDLADDKQSLELLPGILVAKLFDVVMKTIPFVIGRGLCLVPLKLGLVFA
jgi:hypothetical protein